MNVTFEKIDDVNGVLTVAIEEKDYADQVKKQIKEIAKKHTEPGFRPGKVPAALINKKFGEPVKYDTINKVVGEAVYDYLKEQDLRVLGNPVPEKNEDFDLKNSDFTFKFKVGIAPEIDTHVNKDMHIPAYKIQVSDEMIDTQDKNLRRRFGKQEAGETVEPTSVVKGEMVELDENGQPKEGGLVIEDAIVGPEHFKSEDEKAKFVGKKVDETLVFNPFNAAGGNDIELSSMLHIEKEDVENHKGDFSFKVKESINLTPAELGQEYYDMVFGKDKVSDEAGYREELKKAIENQLGADSNYRFSIDAKDAILKAVGEIQLPDEVMKEFLITRNKDLNEENIDEEYKVIRPQIEWEVIREAIAKQLEVKVNDEDIKNLARAVARNQFAQYGMTQVPDEMLEKYTEQLLGDERYRDQLVSQAVDMKLYQAIKEAVSADETPISVEDFNKLFAPVAE